MSTLRPTVIGLLVVAIIAGPVVGTVGAAGDGSALQGGDPGADAAVGGSVVDAGVTSVARAGNANDLDNETGDALDDLDNETDETLDGELNGTETFSNDTGSSTDDESTDDNESTDDESTVEETTDDVEETTDETAAETNESVTETVDDDEAVDGAVGGLPAVTDDVPPAETMDRVDAVRETADATTLETTATTVETIAYLERETDDAAGTVDDLGSSLLTNLDDDSGDDSSPDDDPTAGESTGDSSDAADDEVAAGWDDRLSSFLSAAVPTDLSEWAILGSVAMLTAAGGAAVGGLNALPVATGAKTAALLAPAARLGSPALSTKFLKPAITLSARIAGSLGTLARLLGAVGLGYARHDDTDPLEHEDRNRIYGQIRESPGVFLSAVSDRTGIPLSTVRHHLKVLERERLVTTSKVRGKRRYYPLGTKNPDLAAALEDGITADILERLVKVGPANVTSLADELDRDPSTISHHLSQLEEDDLIERERRGRSKIARATPAVVDEIENLTAEPRSRPAAASSAD